MSAPSVLCAVCGTSWPDLHALAAHLVTEADESEPRHVMWLNRNVTKHRTSVEDLVELLRDGTAGERVNR